MDNHTDWGPMVGLLMMTASALVVLFVVVYAIVEVLT